MRRGPPQSGHGRAAGSKGPSGLPCSGRTERPRPQAWSDAERSPTQARSDTPIGEARNLERGFRRSVHTLEAVLTGEGQECRPALQRAEAFGTPSAQSSGRVSASARSACSTPAAGTPRVACIRTTTEAAHDSVPSFEDMLRTLPWLVEVGTISIMRIGSRQVGGMVRRKGTMAEWGLSAYAASAVSLPAASSAGLCRPSGSGRRGGIPNHVMRGWSRAVTILRGITCYISARGFRAGSLGVHRGGSSRRKRGA